LRAFRRTEPKSAINPDAVRLMKALFGIDMEQSQRPKLLSEIPPVDVVVTMGCNVGCPYLPGRRTENWGLDDPTGRSDEAFLTVIRQIETKIMKLAEELRNRPL
jgi:arsenate reductase